MADFKHQFLIALCGMFFLFDPCLHAQTQKEKPLSGLNTESFKPAIKTGDKWKNNPFAQSLDDVSVTSLKLFAIVYHPKDAAALISHHIVRVGDKIGSAEVVSIKKREVVLRDESGIFKLNFESRRK